MLFTSSAFLYAFLPAVLAVFFVAGKLRAPPAALVYGLVGASLFFYGYKDPSNIAILSASVLGNYGMSRLIRKSARKKLLFGLGVAFNLALLGYFKYTNFILGNIAILTGGDFTLITIALPLAISFYTFQQIAYLADTKDGLTPDDSFASYILFVTFFPQLIIGPIVHHREMMPQFADNSRFGRFDWSDFKTGWLYLMSGLMKKILLSDTCAGIADAVYGGADTDPAFAAVWLGALAFSLQIYFDFSGYSDMALGVARMLGIKIPVNFDSPYKARNMTEFWRRWHMTFSRWLRDYLYIPLGGNRHGKARSALNALVVFLLGGLWHGAAWGFVLWGLFQGLGIVAARLLEKAPFRTPHIVAAALTFLFVTLTWVVFRAPDLSAAFSLYGSLFGLRGLEISLPPAFIPALPTMAAAALLAFAAPNTHSLIPRAVTFSEKIPQVPVAVMMIVVWLSMAAFNLDSSTEFIYFDF